MTGRRPIWSIALCGVAALAMAAPAAASAAEPSVVYSGTLKDAKSKPISGIFPLTFSLYRARQSKREAWSESHYVAVDNGRYEVALGEKRPIPKGLQLDRVYLGVGLTGGAEFVRERLSAGDAAAGANGGKRDGGTKVDYATEAGFAYEAEQAKSAATVGSLTQKDIEKLVKSQDRTVVVGKNKRYSETAGGQGGQPYTLTCPQGYVVTGIRGGAAAYVDSLSLICSPLE